MKKYNKIIASIAGLVVLFVLSTVGYNALKDRYGNQNQFQIVGNKEEEQTQEETTTEETTTEEKTDMSNSEDTSESTEDTGTSNTDTPNTDTPNTDTESEDVENEDTENTDTENEEQELTLAMDFEVYDQEGNAVTLLSKVGKPIVVNFWASWCSPCKSEMPDFQTMYEELGDEVEFMMVNLTDGMTETKENALKYVNGAAFTFPVYFDTKENAAMTYSVTSIPTTILINEDGYIVASARGMIDLETLRYGIDLIMPNKQ